MIFSRENRIREPIWAPGINAFHPLARGLLLSPPLWEGAGNPWDPFGASIALNGTAAWNALTDGGGLTFDGTSGGYASVAAGGGLNNRDTGSIAMLVRWRGTQDQDGPAHGYGSVLGRQRNFGFSENVLHLTGSNPATAAVEFQLANAAAADGTAVTGTTAVGNGVWRHVVVTFEPGNHRLYLDGVLEAVNTPSPAVHDDIDTPLSIGAWIDDGASWATADIAQLLIYGRPLRPGEVEELYADPFVLHRRPRRLRSGGGAITYRHEAFGLATVRNAATLEARGLHKAGLDPFGGEAAGAFLFVSPFSATASGAASVYNPAARDEVGGYKVGYLPYNGEGAGRHRIFAAFAHDEFGVYKLGYESFAREDSGTHRVYAGYVQEERGQFRFTIPCTTEFAGKHRVANNALDRYELFRAIGGAAIVFTAAPFATFTSLPFVTDPLDPNFTYRFVLRKRNAWGLSSQNLEEWTAVIASDGTQTPTPPSDAVDVNVVNTGGGYAQITAKYFYDLDGANQADEFLIQYVVFDPPGNLFLLYQFDDGDINATETMVKTDGIAALAYTIGPFAEGKGILVAVRTRRAGPPIVSSRIIQVPFGGPAFITLVGPGAISPRGLFIGTENEQRQ